MINKLDVKPKGVDQLLKAWAVDAAYLKQKPGFVSTQLHRGIGESCVFINYAVWDSVEHFKQATTGDSAPCSPIGSGRVEYPS